MSGIIFFSFSPHSMWIFRTGMPNTSFTFLSISTKFE